MFFVSKLNFLCVWQRITTQTSRKTVVQRGKQTYISMCYSDFPVTSHEVLQLVLEFINLLIISRSNPYSTDTVIVRRQNPFLCFHRRSLIFNIIGSLAYISLNNPEIHGDKMTERVPVLNLQLY